MRYPVSPLLWAWPPLWPFLAVVTAAWALTRWTTWLALHLTVAAMMSQALLTGTDIAAHPAALAEYFGIIWGLAAAHLAGYTWHLVHRARARRAARRQAAAWQKYWHDLGQWQAQQAAAGRPAR